MFAFPIEYILAIRSLRMPHSHLLKISYICIVKFKHLSLIFMLIVRTGNSLRKETVREDDV